jgi:hypothetical protein
LFLRFLHHRGILRCRAHVDAETAFEATGCAMSKHFWVVLDASTCPSYFVRFESHDPARWFHSVSRQKAYCFASQADAQHVVAQLKAYGRAAHVVTEKSQKAAPPRPRPRDIFSDALLPTPPPEHLRTWVERILESVPNPTASVEERVKSGYRVLARQHHPDAGGSTRDMQHITEAHTWLQANTWFVLTRDDIPF